MAKRRKSVQVKVSRRKRAASAAPAALRPFLFVSGKSRKGSSGSGRGFGGFMSKRKGKRRAGLAGVAKGAGSFFGKPVVMTVLGATAAAAFGPKVRAMLPASMQTPGSIITSAIVALGGGYAIARFFNREAGAGWAAGALGAELGAMVGNIGAGAQNRAVAQGMRGLPGEAGGVDFLPAMAGYNGGDDEQVNGYGDDDMSGFDSDALEV